MKSLYSFHELRFRACIILPTAIVLLLYSFVAEGDIGRKYPTVIITVDVETTRLGNHVVALPDQVNAVCAGNISCGLQEMVRLLKAKGFTATFFLNVYEYKEYGEPTLRDIAKWFDRSGQDVELHTHPQWAFDKTRNMMFQYNLAEQTEIIRAGKELLHKWTGGPAVAHRAGAYSADENTLKALIANGIFYDSSLFFENLNSRINFFFSKRNALSMYGPLYEFPVTVYRKSELPPFASSYLPSYSTVRKYDINWFGDQAEAEEALDEAIKSKMDFVMLFLHSFSFIKGEDGTGRMTADVDAINRFLKVLDFIGSHGLKTTTFRKISYSNAELNKYLNRQDVVPRVAVKVTLLRYIEKIIGKNDYRVLVLFCSVLAVLVMVSLGLLRRHSSRSDNQQRVERDAPRNGY